MPQGCVTLIEYILVGIATIVAAWLLGAFVGLLLLEISLVNPICGAAAVSAAIALALYLYIWVRPHVGDEPYG